MDIISRLKNFNINWIKTTPERRELIVREVTAGS